MGAGGEKQRAAARALFLTTMSAALAQRAGRITRSLTRETCDRMLQHQRTLPRGLPSAGKSVPGTGCESLCYFCSAGCLCSFVDAQLTLFMRVSFWALYSAPLIYVSVFLPVPRSLDYRSFAVGLKVGGVRPPALLLSRIVRAVWVFSSPPLNFRHRYFF